jgi:type I restriction enzyme, S subunit
LVQAREGIQSMIADLKPYPEYKESGLPWLGQIPRHWTVRRAKSIFQRIDERSKYGREELLTVSSARGVVPRKTANVTMFKAESYRGYKLCWPGDLVINSLWAWAGGLGVSRHHGIISSAYGVYRIRKDAPMTPAFVHEVVRSSSFSCELRVRSKGVWISRLQLTDISFLDAPMHIPRPDEQAAIVRFLDSASGRLDRAIRAKRKVIALLNEQKQAAIHRAITCGCNPSVALKSSGTSWLQDVPSHWEIRRLGRLTTIFNGSTPSRAKPSYWANGTMPWIASGKLNDRRITTPTELVTERALEECSLPIVRSGAVLVGLIGQGRTRGMSAILMIDATISQNLAAIVPRSILDSQFVYYALIACYGYLRDLGRGSNQPALNCEIVGRLPVPVPPLEEQMAIVHEIETRTRSLDTAISRLEREVELLREYRSRLVADVVTGKLDVREAAARLPVEAATDIGEDAADASIDPETGEEEAA